MSYHRERYLSPIVFRRALSELSGLSISLPKIYTMLENRQIRALKIGTHWRIDPNEIDNLPERLIEEQKGLPTDPQQLLGTPKAKKTAPDEVGAENSDY
jgi:excisionase family DNA binding protein